MPSLGYIYSLSLFHFYLARPLTINALKKTHAGKYMISVILYRPETAGNVGAVARVMKNFGFSQLYLITPQCDIKDEVAFKRARHAHKILGSAMCLRINDLSKFTMLVGTTALLGTEYNIARIPTTPRVLAEDLEGVKGNIGILFGPEGQGLPTALLRMCDYAVHIPTSRHYHTMNLSHAVAIVLYELSQKRHSEKSLLRFSVAPRHEKDVLLRLIADLSKKMRFPTPQKRETQLKIWQKFVGKARLTRRELFGVIGFFRQVERTIGIDPYKRHPKI